MAGCEAGPRATASEAGSSSPGHHLSEVNALAPAPAAPNGPAYVDALVEAVMAQDVLSVLLALRVLCAKGLLYSGRTGVDAKHSTLGVSALELQMRQADSPHGQAILQLLFLNLDGCLKWKPFDGPLYHHGSLKKWARAALQAFKTDKGRSSTVGRSLLRTTDDSALRCLLRANGLERRTVRAANSPPAPGSGLDRSSSAQTQPGRAEAVRDGDEIPIKEEEIEEGQLPTDEPRTCETTLDPLESFHQRRRMDHCSTSRPLDLGPLSHAVRFDPYPTPSLSPPPVSPPQPVEGQDERPHCASVVTKVDGSEVAPQRSAFNRPSWEENLPQPFRPSNDRRQEAKVPPPSEPPFFALPSTTTSRKRSASPSPVGWASPLPGPPPVEKRSRLVHPSRKHVRWATQEFVVVGSGAGHVAEEDLYCEDEVEEGRPSLAVVAAGARGAAWAPTAWPPLPQKVLEVLKAERLPDHHVESTSPPVKAPATSSAVPSSWTAWYNDCLDPV